MAVTTLYNQHGDRFGVWELSDGFPYQCGADFCGVNVVAGRDDDRTIHVVTNISAVQGLTDPDYDDVMTTKIVCSHHVIDTVQEWPPSGVGRENLHLMFGPLTSN